MNPGTRLGPYEIVSPLGAGGMGAVYRATDTKLGRDVAIKVLPPAFAEDAARMQRFQREAQVLASLNHPNIAAIYGIEQGAIVMELVDGEDLHGPVPLDTALDYARQIAAGLEAAHEKGIVHRDLKPANIKVTPEGQIKLLDFGLAKATEPSAAAGGSASPTMSPTLSLAMTQEGVILGTAAYMSPEQARGKPVDRRADIWAFGVILYELLTGSTLFGGGETVSDAMAAVIKETPDLKRVPPQVRKLLRACLEKDPRQRLQAIGDWRLLLDEAPAAPVLPTPMPRRWLPWTVAAAGLAIAAIASGLAWMRSGPPDSGLGTVRFAIPLPQGTTWAPNGSATEWVPSPDGRNLAMILTEGANTSLWVRPLNAPQAHRLDKTEGANYPFWSPDGQSIGFFVEGSLRRIPVSGGASVRICDLPAGGTRSPGDGGAWNRDGVIVFALSEGPLLRVSAAGGIPVPATSVGKDETAHHWPQFLPDGRHILYEVRGGPGGGGIYVQELGSQKRARVMKSAMRAVWSPPGYLLYPSEGNLFAQRMNPRTFQLEGEPLLVAEDVRANPTNGRSTFAVSENGVLVYRILQGQGERQLTWRDRQGKVLSQIGKPVQANIVMLSPDEKSAALVVVEGSSADIWVMDLASGVIAPVTHGGEASPRETTVWSPDSKRLAILLASGKLEEIDVASGQRTLLTKEAVVPEDWAPDGRSILARDRPALRFSLLSLSEGHPLQPILATPYVQVAPRLSPDGKYVAYQSFETGSAEIYVAAFPSFSVKRKVSGSGGIYPAWAKGGRAIFYRAGDGSLTEAEIRTAPDLEVGDRRQLFKFGSGEIRGNRFGVTADGQQFLIAESALSRASDVSELSVVINWPAEMKQQ
ncbi:MAG TPA: protein kinase [Verrucomicrobiae bacterium]|nr:protein kinase [Verrucomicrobiae bacterium]